MGSNEELAHYSADNIVDLEGKTVLPGFNDSHLHISGIGALMNTCNLTQVKSIDDIIQLGRNFLKNKPNLKALHGRGWNQDYFTTGERRLLTRFDLDKISTEIPIVFDRVCVDMYQ